MKIVCFGSINMDIVYAVPHIAVAGETIVSTARAFHWGGKGLNQAVALAKSFPEVYMAGFINKNEESVLDYMRGHNINTKYVRLSEHSTGHAVIYVDKNGQNSITVFSGSNHDFTLDYVKETLNDFEKGDMVLLQNETNGIEWVINEAHDRGMIVAINPSPFDASILNLPLGKVGYFLYNEIEAEQISGKPMCESMIHILSDKYPNAVHVLTLGKDGVMCKKGTEVYTHGIYDVKVVDTTAAGDTFTGYFLAGVLNGAGIAQALELASKASSIAVSRSGATDSIPSESEVNQFVARLIS